MAVSRATLVTHGRFGRERQRDAFLFYDLLEMLSVTTQGYCHTPHSGASMKCHETVAAPLCGGLVILCQPQLRFNGGVKLFLKLWIAKYCELVDFVVRDIM